MSGILDNKSRVIDTIITTEGRRQLAMGGIDIQYVSFTDGSTFYRSDLASGSQDATQRIYLEACQLPQDEITFRADESGDLEAFRNADSINMVSGRILEYSLAQLTHSQSPTPSQTVTSLCGDRFVVQSERVLASSADNFKRLYLIATQDSVFDDDQFALGPNDVTYVIHDERPLPNASTHAVHVTARDSVHTDPRFSDKLNFRYLPPVNKLPDRSTDRSDFRALRHSQLAFFKPLGRTHLFGLKYPQVARELRHYHDLGYSRNINFEPTSNDNRLIGQFFERTNNSIRKLDVIDYGKHNTGDVGSPLVHVFFVGKVEVDEKGTDTFIHLFTLVFE